jgi:hypothetical protein
VLWANFIILYYLLYIPPLPPEGWDNMNIEFWTYFLKSCKVILAFCIISIQKNQRIQFNMLLSISLGMLFFAGLTSVFTLLYLDPPYYGKALHPFYKVVMNSPGSTILGGIASILVISFISDKNWKSKSFILLNIFLISVIFLKYLSSRKRKPILLIKYKIMLKYFTF